MTLIKTVSQRKTWKKDKKSKRQRVFWFWVKVNELWYKIEEKKGKNLSFFPSGQRLYEGPDPIEQSNGYINALVTSNWVLPYSQAANDPSNTCLSKMQTLAIAIIGKCLNKETHKRPEVISVGLHPPTGQTAGALDLVWEQIEIFDDFCISISSRKSRIM